MPVFKLITKSSRRDIGFEVTRWALKDEVKLVTWERLIERVQRLLDTRATGFYLSWFNGLNYCSLKDYTDLQDAAQVMMSQGDASIRIYVSRDKPDPSTVFGPKPCMNESTEEQLLPITEKKPDTTTKPSEEPECDSKTEKQPKPADDFDSSSTDSDSDMMVISHSELEQNPKLQPEEEMKWESETKPEYQGEVTAPSQSTRVQPKPATQTSGQHVCPFPRPNFEQHAQVPPYPAYFAAPLAVAPVFYGFTPVACVAEIPISSNNIPFKYPVPMQQPTMTNDQEHQCLINELKRLSTNSSEISDPARKGKFSKISVETLRAMGFRHEQAYLEWIIKKTNGDVNLIIDLLETKK